MPNIHHKLVVGAPAEKVYSAIISQEGLSAWWTPHTDAKPEVDSIARFAFGPTYFKEMKITALKPFEQVNWICITGAAEWINTTISFNLEAANKNELLNSDTETSDQIRQSSNDQITQLTFQHDDWKDYTPMYAECSYTWAQFLRSLKLYCETGKGTPWPDQHRGG